MESNVNSRSISVGVHLYYFKSMILITLSHFTAMSRSGVTVCCYWGGNMLNGPEGLYYDIDCKRVIKVPMGTTYF